MLLLVALKLSSEAGSFITLHLPRCNPLYTEAETLHIMGITTLLEHCDPPSDGSDPVARSVPHVFKLQLPEDIYSKQ